MCRKKLQNKKEPQEQNKKKCQVHISLKTLQLHPYLKTSLFCNVPVTRNRNHANSGARMNHTALNQITTRGILLPHPFPTWYRRTGNSFYYVANRFYIVLWWLWVILLACAEYWILKAVFRSMVRFRGFDGTEVVFRENFRLWCFLFYLR